LEYLALNSCPDAKPATKATINNAIINIMADDYQTCRGGQGRIALDLSSVAFVIIKLNEFLVDPMPRIKASPDLAVHEPAGNRSARNDDRPKVPGFGPCRRRLQTVRMSNVVTVCGHEMRPQGEIDKAQVSLTLSLGRGGATKLAR
jgi:hypothetical protein